MRITILAVPDCPNAAVAAGRIGAALAGRAQATVELVEVTGETEAARLGMTGSPTILLDGVDPFAAAGAVPSVSCRIYRGPDGAADGAPSVQDLTAALSAAGLPGAAGDEGGEADVPDPVGRAGRSRRAPAAGGLRAVHQAVLQHFTATGSAAEPEALKPAAVRYGRTAGEVLAELAGRCLAASAAPLPARADIAVELFLDRRDADLEAGQDPAGPRPRIEGLRAEQVLGPHVTAAADRGSRRRVLHAVAAAIAAHVIAEPEICRVLMEARALAAADSRLASTWFQRGTASTIAGISAWVPG